MKYNPLKIEKKWQRNWEKEKIFQARDFSKKPKSYFLVEFPYPSGEGLHVGHCRSYTAMDIIARKKRMEGGNVLFPMGWDAFGLPSENYAVKTGIHPKITTRNNSLNFKRQLKMLGFSFDWSREVNTTDPEYYKWTQWIFLKMFEKGLAYKEKMPINWCLSCKIGLANEEVVDGKCERCGGQVEKREREQWMLKITKYAERLIKDLDLVDYPERVKTLQKDWVGRSEGAKIIFKIANSCLPADRANYTNGQIEVFTTRPDTLFGATYLVVSPEHPLLRNNELGIKNYEEVKEYIKEAKKKSDLQRTDLAKEKTGVELKGIKAINPVNNKELPVFTADYILSTYGTGAIMAVPAHDERDFEFAEKYKLPIIQSIVSDIVVYKKTEKVLNVLSEIYEAAKKKNIKFWVLGSLACAFYAKIIYRECKDIDLVTKDKISYQRILELFSELGFQKVREKKLSENLTNSIYKNKDGIEIDIGPNVHEFDCRDSDFEEEEKTLNQYRALILSKRFIKKYKEYQLKNKEEEKNKIDWAYLNNKVFSENGFLVNSGEFNGMSSEKAKWEIMKFVGGKKEVNYKLHDWIFSRQRYWGEPMPLIFCPNCKKSTEISNSKFLISKQRGKNIFNQGEILNPGWVAVPEKDLPVKLPDIKDFNPSETGESPLAKSEKWINVKCPKCGGPAKRETDVMPNWAGSNWYYLAYLMPRIQKSKIKNQKLKSKVKINGYIWDKERMSYWMPIDWYNGGMEHTTLHLLYSRFVYKFLWDIGAVPKNSGSEPYKKRTSHGMILGEGGVKMSKSKGNVVNPDNVAKEFGSDTLRVYEMFMGPFEQMIAWDEKGVRGARRFLERIWGLKFKVSAEGGSASGGKSQKSKVKNLSLEKLLNKTIKKVSEDIENMKFNTAISSLMILSNEMEKEEKLPKKIFEEFIILFSPFALHIAEEIWQSLGNKKSIFLQKWPKWDKNMIKDEKIILAVQINGKFKTKIEIEKSAGQQEAENMALANEKIKQSLSEKEIARIIFIRGKIINFVVKK